MEAGLLMARLMARAGQPLINEAECYSGTFAPLSPVEQAL